ncbi:hypothetical protein J25TS5_49180 [Paenibacillus faecis]|nr:hypothetical protein J25TS5_49180 [Paenibacillus faecis]
MQGFYVTWQRPSSLNVVKASALRCEPVTKAYNHPFTGVVFLPNKSYNLYTTQMKSDTTGSYNEGMEAARVHTLHEKTGGITCCA